MANRLRWSGAGCLVVVLACLALAGPLMTRTYHVRSDAMLPTIGLDDRVLAWRTDDPRRGDIIAFAFPVQPDTTGIKRVIAMPGEIVEIRDKRVLINGKPLDEPYVQHDDPRTYPRDPQLPEPYRSRDQLGPYRIAPGTYFVLGDNRDRSSDSRYWGTVPRKNVVGVVKLVYWPMRGFVRR